MKKWKQFVLGVVFTAFVVSLAIGEVYAQSPDLNQWVGKWFNGKSTTKGISFGDSKFSNIRKVDNFFLKIWNWDSTAEKLKFDVYTFDKGEQKWNVGTHTFHFLAGTDIKFLCWLQEPEENSLTVLAVVIDGKLKNDVLHVAKMTTLGGVLLDAGDSDETAGSFTVSGQMTDRSRVPVPENVILH